MSKLADCTETNDERTQVSRTQRGGEAEYSTPQDPQISISLKYPCYVLCVECRILLFSEWI